MARDVQALDAHKLGRIQACARLCPGLQLLALFGSRGRQTARIDSDWDFAAIDTHEGALDLLLGELVAILGTEKVDLVNLTHAGGLLRYHVARDGVLLYEARPKDFMRFRLGAIGFWCEAGPLIEQGYRARLMKLPK